MGRADRPKGLLKTKDQKFKVIPFQQSASYYLQKGTYYNEKNRLSKALLFLQKAIEADPADPKNHYNLACLLSKTSNLREANQIFERIVKEMDPELIECYFFMAVNSGLLEEIEEARAYLLKYLESNPEGPLAEEAEDLLYAIEEEDEFAANNRVLNSEENQALFSLVEEVRSVKFKRKLLEDQELLGALKKGLYSGSDILKEAIIRLLGDTGCLRALKVLAEFLINPWVKERLRQVALLELKRNNPTGEFKMYFDGQINLIDLPTQALPAPVWEVKWDHVLECVFANMRRKDSYSEEFFEDVEAIWLDYINNIYPAGPRVEKPQTWAAALEYCLARFHFLGTTQKELAKAYGISAGSVGRRYHDINRILKIDHKAYKNMLTYFSRKES